MNQENSSFWRKCSTCKKPIQFGQNYWVCSVSTCNRQRTALAFCELGCFDSHIPIFNHRDAGAFERKAPSAAEWAKIQAGEAVPSSNKGSGAGDEGEILVVVSKIKQLIRENSGFNTSDGVMPVLSDHIRKELDKAIAHANSDGRKTVMERDFI